MTSWDSDPFTGPRGYRPYHRRDCPARDIRVPLETVTVNDDGVTLLVHTCTCGGLDHPLRDEDEELRRITQIAGAGIAVWEHGRWRGQPDRRPAP